MKKFLYTLLFLCLFSSVTNAYALTPSATPTSASATTSATPTQASNIINEINNLKDRIASRVAQLNLVEKKGFIGVVTDIGETQLTLSDKNNNTRYVDVDELTKFFSPSAKDSFGISDITKGSTVGILGRYNKDSKRTLARFVSVLIMPQIISGTVTNIDSDNFLLTIMTPEQKETQIDIETITKTYAYTKDGGTAKSGFSKIKIGERVMIVGFSDKIAKNKILASRIIHMPEVKPNPRIQSVKLQNSEITPSTGSGMKLAPITGTKSSK